MKIERWVLEIMNLPDRVGLVIWLYTPKYVNKLKRYGLLHYVSRKMNYAILYVNNDEVNTTEQSLLKLHFVRNVELSQSTNIDEDYEDVLEEVKQLTKEQKGEDENENFSLFTELSGQGEFKL